MVYVRSFIHPCMHACMHLVVAGDPSQSFPVRWASVFPVNPFLLYSDHSDWAPILVISFNLHLCVNTHSYTNTCAHARAHGGQKTTSRVIPCVPFTFIVFCPSLLPQHWGHKCSQSSGFLAFCFTRGCFTRVKLRSLCVKAIFLAPWLTNRATFLQI